MSKIHFLVGDATYPQEKGFKIIAHICNDIGVWGGGFVLAINKRWTQPKERYLLWHKKGPNFKLGATLFVHVAPDITVANMVAQRGLRILGVNPKPIRYKSLENCLRMVAQKAKEKNASVHIPRIGCGLAGGDWSIIEEIINEQLIEQDIDVFVYDFKKQKTH